VGRFAVNIRGNGLAELLEDPRVLGLWELLRRSARPLAIKELSNAARCRASDVQRAIDALVIHGLAKPVRVAEHRPEATYRSSGNSIAVCADHASDDAILKEATRKLSEAADRLPVAKRSSRGAAASRADAAEPVRFAMPVHLDAADHAERPPPPRTCTRDARDHLRPYGDARPPVDEQDAEIRAVDHAVTVDVRSVGADSRRSPT
jgi:hypothetical protein